VVKLFGRQWTRQELVRHMGSISQLGGVRQAEFSDGRNRGVRTAEFETGTGFNFTVLLDRGMDIGACKYQGSALSWEASPGPAHPAYYNEEGLGWLRSFHGGLVATCGLTYAGAPTVDEGETLGLHGRISNTPASNVWVDGAWRDDEYEMWALGRMREAVVFGENLTLTRRVSAMLGRSHLRIQDRVVNEGCSEQPLMIVYHCNFGFPLLAEGTELIAPSISTVARDAVAQPGLANHASYEAPIDGYAEQCFYHEMRAGEDGYVTVVLANRAFGGGQGLGIYLRYRQAELPRFTQWKMVGAGTYVTGLEPANCGVEGRDIDRASGKLQFIKPGEQRTFMLEIGVLDGNNAIDALTSTLPK